MSTITETLVSGTRTSLHPPKRLLYGPGPSQVYSRVYQAMAQPIVGHLDPYFFQVSQEVQKGLRTAFGTKNELTIPLSATGSGGMETAIANFIEPGTKLALLVNGYFGERIGEMAKRHGAEIVRLEKPWGESFSDDEAAEFIRRERPQIVAFVQAETSTGVFQQSKALCAAAHEVDALGHKRRGGSNLLCLLRSQKADLPTSDLRRLVRPTPAPSSISTRRPAMNAL